MKLVDPAAAALAPAIDAILENRPGGEATMDRRLGTCAAVGAGSRAMRRAAAVALAALAAFVGGEAAAQMPGVTPLGPNYGCIANNNCGRKGTTTNAAQRDYWQNWVCTGCHTGPALTVVASPQEKALMAVPARFWTLHAEAERDGETSIRASQYRMLPPSRINSEFQKLLADRPRRR